jgi:hypothetical protein
MRPSGRVSPPVCTSCDYALSGLTPDADQRVTCPECGRSQWLMTHDPAPTVVQFLLWCCLPPLLLCIACAVSLWYFAPLPLAVLPTVTVLAGVAAPPVYAARITEHSKPRVRQKWLLMLFLGWAANLLIGAAFLAGAWTMI